MEKTENQIMVYTDGSCNHVYKTGGWAAILLFNNEEVLLSGEEQDTTHNRMELFSVLKAFEYIINGKFLKYEITINSDSQYVVNIINRMEKLKSKFFLTAKRQNIQNRDLIVKIINYIDILNPVFVKVKAHQKQNINRNYNRDVDKISRKIVRNYVKKHVKKHVKKEVQ